MSAHDKSVDLFNPESQIPEEVLRRVPLASPGYIECPTPTEGSPSAVFAGKEIAAAELCTNPAFVRGMARLRHARKHP